jgi:histidine triad (HIT) family protein
MIQSNLVIPDNHECAFCDYLKGKRPYTIIYRDENSAIFVTREQRGIGHVLVLPVRHVESILDITDDEAANLMIVMKRVSKALDQAFMRPGISVWQNNGVPAGQAIAHLHFHIAGTLDDVATERGIVPEISVEETNKIGEKLLLFLQNK